MSDNKQQQDLATQIKNYHKSGEFDKALEISEHALKSDPVDLKAYGARWRLIADMFSEADAKERIYPEIETLLKTQPETPEVLDTTHGGYKCLPGRAKNVPSRLFDRMLQYPGTKVYLSALLGLAQRSEDASQKWYYYQRLINECTISDASSSWYLGAYKSMLGLAEMDRSLANDDYLDELIDGYLKAHLFICEETQQWLGWAYRETVKYRLKFNNRLDKALDTLDHAEKVSGEKGHKDFSRLRAEIHFQQEQWQEAYNGLLVNASDFLESLWTRFNKNAISYLYMLGRSAEGIGEWETAKRYYADAHFAPSSSFPFGGKESPHIESQVGLKRVYQQIMRGGITDTFEAFLKDTEAEYRIREDADREKIRQKFITSRLNKKAADFQLETLEGETYTLSAVAGKVVLLDVGASWCGFCDLVIPEVKIVYEQFSKSDEVVVLGISDGDTPEKAQKSMDEHQPPWPVLLDPQQQVSKAYQIQGLPFFILIDKMGNWQYSFLGSNFLNGQPLIWMIEALLED